MDQTVLDPKHLSPEWRRDTHPGTVSWTEVDNDKEIKEAFNYSFDNQTRVYVPGSLEEKKLVRLIDLHMLPCVCFLYFLNYLDRASIGNARIGGMSKDLDLSSSDFSLDVLMFSVGCIVAEIPSTMILSRVRPSRFIPLITFLWGLVATCIGLVKTKTDLVGVRFVLGIAEAGFFPGVIHYLSSWYRNGELAKRIGIFYTAGIISGPVSGLLAGTVITNLNGARGIQGWRWLFIIEGVVTMLTSLVAVLLLPDWPSNTTWLTVDQRALAQARLNAEAPRRFKLEKPLTHFQSFKAAVGDWRTYVFCFMFTMIVSANTVNSFIPTITESLGYTGQKAQFMTVPVHVCAVVSIIFITLSADYFNETAFHIAIPTLISGIMYAICITVTDTLPRYGLLCVGFGVIHGALPIVLTWVSKELGYPDSKRAVCHALVNTAGTVAIIYGSFLWSNPPEFTTGFISLTVFCLSCTAAVPVACILFSRYPSVNSEVEGNDVDHHDENDLATHHCRRATNQDLSSAPASDISHTKFLS